LFALTASKYKIDTTNIPYAIKEIEQKQTDVSAVVKNFKLAISKLTSYDKFVVGEYYKTSRIIRASIKNERNISFVS
jgi:carboxypeptidase C (cathepsin A)